MKKLNSIWLVAIISLNIYAQTAPGGVTGNLQLWLKADAGTTGAPTVTSWADQSGSGNNTTATGDPQLISNAINYNPAIDFDAIGDRFATSATSLLGADNSYTRIVVMVKDDASFGNLISAGASGNNALYFPGTYAPVVYHGGNRITGPVVTQGVPAIVGSRYGLGGEDNVCRTDGLSVVDNTTYTYTDGGTMEIGSFNGGTLHNGYIAEAILYDDELSGTELQRVESYLAIKYGLTLDNSLGGTTGDIVNSLGTVIWDADANTAHHNNVTGIARDDNSNLDQQKSFSSIAGGTVIMDKEGVFPNDRDYVVWGNDGVALDITSTQSHPSYDYRLGRVWKVAVGGTPGTYSVRFIVTGSGFTSSNASDYAIIYDATDTDFSSGASAHTTGASFSGDTLTFTGVSLTDDAFFTLAGPTPVTPGGVVANLNWWLKADAGTTGAPTVTAWSDQSGRGNDVTAVGDPQLISKAINYNPAIDFDAIGDRFATSTTSLLGADNPYTRIAVIVKDDASSGNIISAGVGGDHALYFSNSYAPVVYHNGNRIAAPVVTQGVPAIVGSRYGVGGEDNICRTNGLSVIDNNTYTYSDGGTMEIGSFQGVVLHNGYIAEAIVYNDELSATELQRVESYLAIKYGTTLDNSLGGTTGDIVNSRGTVVWDADVNIAYHNNVTGIARDDNSALDQQKSFSSISGGTVIMDKGGAFPNDIDYVVWGNDGAALDITSTQSHPSYDYRLGRVWKVAVGGTPGTYSVSFIITGSGFTSTNASDYALISDGTDTDFSSGASIHTTGASFNGDTLTFTDVNFSDDDFFTLGGPSPITPGAVFSNLQLWLKGNAGTTGSPTITSWSDQSGKGNNATAAGDPQLISNAINYNPAIDFDALGDRFATSSTSLLGANNPYTKIAVMVKDDASAGNIISAGAGGDHALYFSNSYAPVVYHNGNRIAAPVVTQGVPAIVGSRYGVGGEDNICRTNGLSVIDNNTYTYLDGGIIEIGSFQGVVLHNGYIAEAIVYNDELNSTELQRVESYLAIKYGITLDNTSGGSNGDYLTSDGTTIWDADDNTSYHNDIISIGKDNDELLYQKQSKTSDDSLKVYVDVLAADNISNVGVITNDKGYLVIGHNEGKLQSQLSEIPSGIYSRFEREWKITNTNFSDNFTIEVEWDSTGPFSLGDVRFLVDDDGDFSDATVLSPEDGITISLGSIIIGGISTSEIPMNSTRYFTIGSIINQTPLPVELVNFEAKPNANGEVRVSWLTASEINNDHFIVERSTNGVNWSDWKTIDGAGNSSVTISYNELDKDPFYGRSYYRLRQVDFDGKESLSKVSVVFIEKPIETVVEIFPNPTKGLVIISTNNESELNNIVILNTLGQNVTNLVNISRQSNNDCVVDLSKLNPGSYFLKSRTKVCKIYKN